ncbi:MAG: hypothetical protein ABEH43_08455 [Flavobacteriales bacterium]
MLKLKMTYPVFLALSLLLISCGNDKKNKNAEKNGNKEQSKELEGMKRVSLKEYGLPFKISIPEKSPARQMPPTNVKLNRTTGKVELKSGEKGEKYYMVIYRAEKGIKGFKKEITEGPESLMYDVEIVEETEKKIIYKNKLQDEDKEFMHFIVLKDIKGTTYALRSFHNGQFSKPHVDRMLKSVKSITPVSSNSSEKEEKAS